MKSIFHALNRLKVFRGLTEQEFAWVLYDVGNSAFTMLSCSLIPIWFKSLAIGTAPGQINSHQATAYYSIAVGGRHRYRGAFRADLRRARRPQR